MTSYSEMSDFEINGLIAQHTQKVGDFTQARGLTFIHEYGKPVADFGGLCLGWKEFDPCNNPADAWPIIFKNSISMVWDCAEDGSAEWWNAFDKYDECREQYQSNPLRAAMIVFLMTQEEKHG